MAAKDIEKAYSDQIENVELDLVKDEHAFEDLESASQRALAKKVLWKLDTRYGHDKIHSACSKLTKSLPESFPFSPCCSSVLS